MKISHQLVVSSLAVFVLAACSGSAAQRRQAKDDFKYLETPALAAWNIPQNVQAEFYPNFDIPKGDFKGGIGKTVDIRPPQQILDLIPGARSEYKDGEVTIWLIRQDEADKVWQTIQDMISDANIKVLSETDQRIETDWVSWKSEDEDSEIGSRYEINRFNENGRFGFKVSLIDWREGTQQLPVSVSNKERYNALMTNLVMAKYDQNVRDAANLKAQQLVKQIPMSMGSDRSGFPVIIARTEYNILWSRLPDLLPKMGFTIDDRNQSQGQLKATYAAPDDAFWESIGVKPIELGGGEYTFLFGDLGNRTSINITDSKGKPIEERMLTSLVPVLASIVEQQEKDK